MEEAVLQHLPQRTLHERVDDVRGLIDVARLRRCKGAVRRCKRGVGACKGCVRRCKRCVRRGEGVHGVCVWEVEVWGVWV